VVPDYPAYIPEGTAILAVSDGNSNTAEAGIMIKTADAEIRLDPVVSPASPGYAGMNIAIEGSKFRPNAIITVTYGETIALIVATTHTGNHGDFSAKFVIPNSPAGDHAITASDDTNDATSTFTMESGAPLAPVPQLPTVVITPKAKAHFAWGVVEDISGVTYTFQVAADTNFNTIILEKAGLTEPEYNLTEEEVEIRSSSKESPLYWRVKAVDGAFNESEWTPRGMFYAGLNWTATPRPATTGIWILVVSAGVAVLGLFLLISGMRKPKNTSSE